MVFSSAKDLKILLGVLNLRFRFRVTSISSKIHSYTTNKIRDFKAELAISC